LAGFFGVLARTPFCPSLLRYGSSERDSGRDGHKADEHKHHAATCSRSPWFHLASDRQSIVICGIFVGGTDLPFSKTSISEARPAPIDSERHRSAVLPDLAQIFAGWTLVFLLCSLNDATFRRIILVVLLPSGLLILACSRDF
jgi:hypothetical protein